MTDVTQILSQIETGDPAAAAEQRAPVEVALDIFRSGREQGVSFSMDDRDVRYTQCRFTLP